MDSTTKTELEALIKLGESGVNGRDIADQLKKLIKSNVREHSEVTLGTRVMDFSWYKNYLGTECEKHTLTFDLYGGVSYSLVVLEDAGRWVARVEIGDMHISSLTGYPNAECALNDLVSVGQQFSTALLHLQLQTKL